MDVVHKFGLLRFVVLGGLGVFGVKRTFVAQCIQQLYLWSDPVPSALSAPSVTTLFPAELAHYTIRQGPDSSGEDWVWEDTILLDASIQADQKFPSPAARERSNGTGPRTDSVCHAFAGFGSSQVHSAWKSKGNDYYRAILGYSLTCPKKKA